MKAVAVTSPLFAELVDLPDFTEPLAPGQAHARTLVSLISPGTEVNGAFQGKNVPNYPGYAAVAQVTEIGAEVTNLQTGDVVFISGSHKSEQRFNARDAVKIPDGLAPEVAVFARLMGVSMSSLNVTGIRPPAGVLVTGLGPVGNLAAQIFTNCGYQVTGVDPTASRRDFAQQCGIHDVRGSIETDLQDRVFLHLECSGHDGAVLQGARTLAKNGELFLIGAPWKRRTEDLSYDLIHAVFHRYIILRSGWEWQIPGHQREWDTHSLHGNYIAALDWLQSGRIRVDEMAGLYAPSLCQKVYSGLLDQSLPTPGAVFDWR